MHSEVRKQWLEVRRSGLGSSDAAAILGLSPYRTALHVYEDKVTGVSAPENASMHWGTLLEGVVASAYAAETNRIVVEPSGLVTKHPRYPWMLASIDRWALDPAPGQSKRILECKTCSYTRAHLWGQPGTDEIPRDYYVQVQHQMCVHEAALADVAVLIDNSDFRIYSVMRNDDFCEGLVQTLKDFWAQVLERVPPAPDWKHPSTPALMRHLYGHRVEAPPVVLTDEQENMARQYLTLRQEQRAIQDQADVLLAKLTHAAGASSEAVGQCGYRVARRLVRRREYRVPESAYVRVTVHAPEQKHEV